MAAVDSASGTGTYDNVVVVRWPAQRDEVETLQDAGAPRLWLVEPGAAPPTSLDYLEDWVRLPAEDGDVEARVDTLLARAARHQRLPELDGYGELSFGGRRVFLSPTDERVITLLVAQFEHPVSEQEIEQAVWPDAGNASKVRVHVSRLRKRIAPLELEITAVRNYGYRMHRRDLLGGSQLSVRDPLPNRHT